MLIIVHLFQGQIYRMTTRENKSFNHCSIQAKQKLITFRHPALILNPIFYFMNIKKKKNPLIDFFLAFFNIIDSHFSMVSIFAITTFHVSRPYVHGTKTFQYDLCTLTPNKLSNTICVLLLQIHDICLSFWLDVFFIEWEYTKHTG